MSYSFQVEAKDGELTIANPSQPNVPDGRFTVNGHEEDAWLSIGVTRYDGNNTQIAQASGYGRRS